MRIWPDDFQDVIEPQGRAFDIVSVKNSNDLSEDYNVLLPTDHVQRGNRVYQQTYSPASFPVEAKDAIAYVRVAFYSVQCEDGNFRLADPPPAPDRQ